MRQRMPGSCRTARSKKARNSCMFPPMRCTVLCSEDGGYFYETTPYAPHSPYSASKASSDMLVKAYMDTYHFPANITNCSNNYGPYQFPEKLIPLIINNALAWQEASGIRRRQERPRLALCRGSRKGHRYGTGEGPSVARLTTLADITKNRTLRSSISFWILCRRCFRTDDPRKALVSEDLITYVEDRKGHDRRYAIAPDKIKAEVGWYPETMLQRRHQEDDQMVFRA